MKKIDQQFYYKNNRLQQLRGFCSTIEFGSICRAAEHMGLNQSCVSLQIKALEDSLAVKLFERNGPHIKPTAEGKRLYSLARPYVYGILNLHHEFSEELKSVLRTELHIAANGTSKSYILPEIIKLYTQMYPEIYIVIHFAEHQEAMELIEKDIVDFAILPQRAHLPFSHNFVYTPLFFCTPCLITLPNHPLAHQKNLTVQEISKYELTLPDPTFRVIDNLYEIFPDHNINKKLRVSFLNTESGREFIDAGVAITISSDVWIKKNDTLVATPLPHLFPDVTYGLVKKISREIPEKIINFIAVAREIESRRKAPH